MANCPHKRQFSTHLYCAIFASRLQPQYPQRIRYYHTLLLIVWWRHPFEKFEAFEGSGTPGCLVWNHTPDGPVKNLGRCAVMEGTRLFGINNMAFVKEIVVTKLSEHKCHTNHHNSKKPSLTLFRKKLPEIFTSSHLTTTIFWPERICFEMIEANRPRR